MRCNFELHSKENSNVADHMPTRISRRPTKNWKLLNIQDDIARLTNAQKRVPIKHINKLRNWGLSPTPQIVKNIA